MRVSILGSNEYNFLFDRYLYHFFNEKGIKLFTSLDLNCLQIALDYRHYENDLDPYVLNPEGSKHLDWVMGMCSQAEVCTILNLHAVPGGQNQSWHSDNITSHAAFWDHKTHQDRTTPGVAEYNPLNEPADCSHMATKLVSWCQRVEKAIREVDDKHILFWDGNTLLTSATIMGYYGFP
ncbi:glycoside hydrolase superfamily [Terfezia claveryi]|nr:glycoside hydrolase superfamily [Terfezia claveryi]